MPTKLLLADDSVTIQKVVNLTFAAEDVLIESVTDGDQALEKAGATRPDIVLADVFMPGRNGYQVCEAIKADPELAGTPVVLLVGTFEPFDELEASRVKCDAYLTKPFDTSELIQIVRSLVEKRNSKAEVGMQESAVPEAAVSGVIGITGKEPRIGELVSERARASFLGSNRILDLFDSVVPDPAVPAIPAVEPAMAVAAEEPAAEEPAPKGSAALKQIIQFPGTRSGGPDSAPIPLSEEMVNLIVERVVKRISQEVVREIAWEVVPELSEILIRQHLDELKVPNKN